MHVDFSVYCSAAFFFLTAVSESESFPGHNVATCLVRMTEQKNSRSHAAWKRRTAARRGAAGARGGGGGPEVSWFKLSRSLHPSPLSQLIGSDVPAVTVSVNREHYSGPLKGARPN